MNNQLFEQARAAYQARDFAAAASMLAAVKDPGEAFGAADHLLGNSLMKLGRPGEAAAAYESALADAAYGKRGALLTNQGKALVASGDAAGAVECFKAAVGDASYATPYKAYAALGNALLSLGNPMEAGVAFRQAALDEANPDPESSLASLGSCFMQLGRPQDAVESYRTAIDFAGDHDPRPLYASLGEACVAAGRMDEALDAFSKALADGIYTLSPEADAADQQARQAMSGGGAIMDPATGAVRDPLDPLGKSGAFMPDPSDTGFFTLSESELIQQDRQNMKVRRRHRHLGLKIFLVILLLLLLAAGGTIFAFTRGFGIPSQQDALTGLFQADSSGSDPSQFLPESMSDESKRVIAETVPNDAVPTITNMDQSMTESQARVSVQLSQGGTVEYDVTFVRQGFGWVVSGITPYNASTEGGATLEGTSTDAEAASDEATSDDASAEATDSSADAGSEAEASADASASEEASAE